METCHHELFVLDDTAEQCVWKAAQQQTTHVSHFDGKLKRILSQLFDSRIDLAAEASA